MLSPLFTSLVWVEAPSVAVTNLLISNLWINPTIDWSLTMIHLPSEDSPKLRAREYFPEPCCISCFFYIRAEGLPCSSFRFSNGLFVRG